MMTKEELIAKVRSLPPEVVKIRAEYNGSGDSGDMEPVNFLDADNDQVGVEDEVAHQFRELFWQLLERDHGGWEINEGSNGWYELTINDFVITNEHTEYYTEYNTNTTHPDL